MLSGSRGDSTTGHRTASCPISSTEAGLKPGSSQKPHYLSWAAEGDVWSFVPEPLVFYLDRAVLLLSPWVMVSERFV